MKKETIIIYIFAALSVLGASLPTLASEAGGEAHGYDWMGFGWQIVNFAVLVTLLVLFARKPLRDYLKARTEAVKKSLEEARQARELAEKALAEVEGKLKDKDREIAEVVAAAEKSGQAEKEALIEEGERLAQKLIEQARSNIDYELKQAREAIKAEAVELAMELAEKKIKDKLGEDEQKKLFEDALQRLERRS